MAKKIDRGIMKVLDQYIEEIKKHCNVDFVFLFGFFAKGTTHVDSDIDVAIVSSDIKGVFGERQPFMKMRRNIDLRIEPHPISTIDYQTNATSLVNEVRKHGIQLYAA